MHANYEISQKELRKVHKRINKYARMIDPKDLVDGHEFLEVVQ